MPRGPHLTALGHGKASSEQQDDVPGHRLLGLPPGQQGLGLCVWGWTERKGLCQTPTRRGASLMA